MIKSFWRSLVKLFLTKITIKSSFSPFVVRDIIITGQIDEFENLIDLGYLLPWNKDDEKDLRKNWILAIYVNAGLIYIKYLMMLLKEETLTKDLKDFITKQILKIVKKHSSDNFGGLTKLKAQDMVKNLIDAKKICHNLSIVSIGGYQSVYSEIEDYLTFIIRKIRKDFLHLSIFEKIKLTLKSVLGLTKEGSILTWTFLFVFGIMILLGLLVIAPYLQTFAPTYITLFIVIGMIFAVIMGLGVFPTVSEYIEKVYRGVEIASGISDNLEKAEMKTKRFLLYLLDIGVVIYLVNSIRKLVKLVTLIDLIPFTAFIESVDLILLNPFISILGALMVTQGLYSRGIRHLWTASSEELKPKGKLRNLVLPVGIVGTFAFVVVYMSTWAWSVEIAQNLGIVIGALIYLELKFKNRWRLKVLLYAVLTVGIIGTYTVFYFLGLAYSVTVSAMSSMVFLFCLTEGSRKTYWLSDCFESPWKVKSDSKLERFHGVLIEKNEADVLNSLESLIVENVEFEVRKGNIISIKLRYIIRLKRLKEYRDILESIGKLKSLQTIDLSNNALHYGRNTLGDLFESICKLESLTELNLSTNKLKLLPESIGKLKSLRILNLSNNRLTSLPESIGNLGSLEILDLVSNQFKTLPVSIGALNSLQTLYLFDNKITILPESMVNLRSLKTLSLSNNVLKAKSTVYYDKLNKLVHNLEQQGCRILERVES